jgi:hypothetical protein
MCCSRVQEQVDEQPLDGHRIVTDLMIARRLQATQLQPVERRLAGHRRAILAARSELAREHRLHRIVAQLVVVVEILIAKRNPKHPLRPASPLGARSVPGTAGREAIRPAQQQRSGIRRDRARIERRYHRPAFNRFKSKEIRATTLCRRRGAPRR